MRVGRIRGSCGILTSEYLGRCVIVEHEIAEIRVKDV